MFPAGINNRPPTGGDLTFSWKEGHICTVVLLEVLSQLCHGQLVMGGRWQIAAASDWAGFSMGRGGAAHRSPRRPATPHTRHCQADPKQNCNMLVGFASRWLPV